MGHRGVGQVERSYNLARQGTVTAIRRDFPKISSATAKCEIGKNMVVNDETESKALECTDSNYAWHVTLVLACAMAIQRDDD